MVGRSTSPQPFSRLWEYAAPCLATFLPCLPNHHHHHSHRKARGLYRNLAPKMLSLKCACAVGSVWSKAPPPRSPLSLTHHLASRPRIPGPTRSQGRKAQEETSHSEMRSPGQKKKLLLGPVISLAFLGVLKPGSLGQGGTKLKKR